MMDDRKDAAKSVGKSLLSGILSGDDFSIPGFMLEIRPAVKTLVGTNRKALWSIVGILAIFSILNSFTHSAALAILIMAFLIGILATQPKPRAYMLKLFKGSRGPGGEFAELLKEIYEPQAPPRIISYEDAETVTKLKVQLLPGHSLTELEKALETFLITFHFGSGRIARDPENAALVELAFVKGAPLAKAVMPWTSNPNVPRSVWEVFPLGILEDGSTLELEVYAKNLFIAGEPGSGKTVTGRNIVANFMLDPTTKVFIGDAKGVDFSAFAPLCVAYAGPDLEEWKTFMEAVLEELNSRLAYLRTNRKKKWDPSCGGLVLVLLEEFGTIVSMGKEAKEIVDGARDLLQRGRAVGMIAVLSTQRPGSDTFPTALRDLVGVRISFRCSTRDASDIALGSGWASQGANAANIPISAHGVGYCLADHGVPEKFRGVFISDDQEEEIIEAAARMRGVDLTALDELDEDLDQDENEEVEQ